MQFGASEHLELVAVDHTPAEVDEAFAPASVNERSSVVQAVVELFDRDLEGPARSNGVTWEELDNLSTPLDTDMHVVVTLVGVGGRTGTPGHLDAFDHNRQRLRGLPGHQFKLHQRVVAVQGMPLVVSQPW